MTDSVWKNTIQTPLIIVVACIGGLALLGSVIYCLSPCVRELLVNVVRRTAPPIVTGGVGARRKKGGEDHIELQL